ncbi:MAG: MBL fold metallo-hydrolase RNA specificity domain-containing protein [Terriglobia bacterium]
MAGPGVDTASGTRISQSVSLTFTSPLRTSVRSRQTASASRCGWLGNFKRAPKGVFIVHGEPQPRRALREKIVKELGWKVCLPEHLERFDLT